jgi:hypothetical protein
MLSRRSPEVRISSPSPLPDVVVDVVDPAEEETDVTVEVGTPVILVVVVDTAVEEINCFCDPATVG